MSLGLLKGKSLCTWRAGQCVEMWLQSSVCHEQSLSHRCSNPSGDNGSLDGMKVLMEVSLYRHCVYLHDTPSTTYLRKCSVFPFWVSLLQSSGTHFSIRDEVLCTPETCNIDLLTTALALQLQVALVIVALTGILMCILLVYCWKRNRK